MHDGVKLAVDVILPEPMPAPRVPVVLLQTRYWRSLALRFPDQPGVPPSARAMRASTGLWRRAMASSSPTSAVPARRRELAAAVVRPGSR